MTPNTNKGINYGHHLTTAVYLADPAAYMRQVKSELRDILNQGYTKLRVDYPQWNGSTDAIYRRKLIVTAALDMGFKTVLWGVVHSRPTITATNYTSSSNYILTDLLPWAQTVNDSRLRMSLGNEEENKADGTTITASTMQTNLKSLATSAQAIYTAGPIDYVVSIDDVAPWISGGKGDLDLLGINIYKGFLTEYAGFVSALESCYTTFGSNMFIGEFNTGNGFPDAVPYGYSAAEELWTKANLTRRKLIDGHGIEWYFFCYRDGQSSVPANSFSLRKTNGDYRKAWDFI